MKRRLKIEQIGLVLVLVALAMLGCNKQPEPTKAPSNVEPNKKTESKEQPKTNMAQPWTADLPQFSLTRLPKGEGRVFHDLEGNFLSIPTAYYAWAALDDLVAEGEGLKLKGLDKEGEKLLASLNAFEPKSFGLKEGAILSGSGRTQADADKENARIKEAFPGLNFRIGDLDLDNHHVFAYACLRQSLKYREDFEEMPGKFLGKEVKGFGAKGKRYWVKVWRYDNKDRFVMSIDLKGGEEQLFLAKGLEIGRSDRIARILDTLNLSWDGEMQAEDEFWAPEIGFNLQASFAGLLGHGIENKWAEALILTQFEEHFRFKMDKKGMELEGSSVMMGKDAIKGMDGEPKKLILDKPYWIILKNYEAKEPYFMLCVRNRALMMAPEVP